MAVFAPSRLNARGRDSVQCCCKGLSEPCRRRRSAGSSAVPKSYKHKLCPPDRRRHAKHRLRRRALPGGDDSDSQRSFRHIARRGIGVRRPKRRAPGMARRGPRQPPARPSFRRSGFVAQRMGSARGNDSRPASGRNRSREPMREFDHLYSTTSIDRNAGSDPEVPAPDASTLGQRSADRPKSSHRRDPGSDQVAKRN